MATYTFTTIGNRVSFVLPGGDKAAPASGDIAFRQATDGKIILTVTTDKTGNSRIVINPAVDTTVIDTTTYAAGTSADTVYAALLAVFPKANTGSGGSGTIDVIVDTTLVGNGTDATPLGVATDIIATKTYVDDTAGNPSTLNSQPASFYLDYTNFTNTPDFSPYVNKTINNTYTAGAKQSFGASATNAGFALSGVTANPSALAAGDIWYRSDEGRFRYYDGTTPRAFVTEQLTQTLTNKTIDGASNTITNVSKQVMTGNAANGTVAASTTSYILPCGGTTFTVNEGIRSVVMTEAYTIKNFYVFLNLTHSANGSLTLTIRKNTANTTVQIVIPTGSTPGNYSDLTHSFSGAAGDKISIQGTNAGTDAASGQIAAFGFSIYY